MRWALLLFAATIGCGRIDFNELARADGGDMIDSATRLGPACPGDPRLLACFDFEQQTLDQTGRGNDAVATNTTFTPGIESSLGLHMDASSRTDLTTPNLGSSQFSIDVWIYPDGEGNGAARDLFDHDMHWAIELAADGSLLCWSGGNPYATTGAVQSDRWTHVACTFDGLAMRGYIDGALELQAAAPMYAINSGAAAVGGDAPNPPGGLPWLGTLDRLRIWNTALSSAELQAAAGQ